MKKRDKILECARDLFSSEGFDKISTKKIAQVAECNEVTIFRLFGSKTNLLEELLNKFVEESKIIKSLHESMSGDIDSDIAKSMQLYQNFLSQHEIIFRLQLKLNDEKNRFIRTIDFKNYLTDHFIEIFYLNKIHLNAEAFVHDMLSGIMGAFLLKILTKDGFSSGKDSIFLGEKIKFFQDIVKYNKQKD